MNRVVDPKAVRRIAAGMALSLCLYSSSAMADEDEPDLVEGPGEVEYLVEDNHLTTYVAGEEEATTRIPCTGPAVVEAEHLFVACGDRGLLVLSVDDPAAPRVQELISIDVGVDDIYRVGDELWLDYGDGSGESLEAGEVLELGDDPEPEPPEEPEEPAEPADPVEPEPLQPEPEQEEEVDEDDVVVDVEGRIIDVQPGAVTIDIGQEDGLVDDHNIELYEVDEETERERSIAVGRIIELGPAYADVWIPYNVDIAEGMRARVTDKRQTVGAPPRLDDVRTIQLFARPFLPLESMGVGLLTDFRFTYYFDSPLVWDVNVDPLAISVTGSSDDILRFAANSTISWVGDGFQAGLGAGATQTGLSRREDGSIRPELVSFIRFGRLEQRYVTTRLHFVIRERVTSDSRGWRLGRLDIEGAGQLRPNTWFMGRIGGGYPGYFLVEGGLRNLMAGSGGRNSFFVTPTLGWAVIGDDNSVFTGPMVGVGLEWRQ